MPTVKVENRNSGDLESDLPDRVHLLAQLPKDVRDKVSALRKLQLDALNIEADFCRAIHKLECEYQNKFRDLNQRRKDIVLGSIEPSLEETEFPLFDKDEAVVSGDFEKMCLNQTESHKEYEGKKGIYKFWLHVLQNLEATNDLIEAQDEEVLAHLVDITCELHAEPMSYTLAFYFSPNEYFENEVLTKKYFLKCDVNKERMSEFEGLEIYKTEGCEIKWKPGKDTTMKEGQSFDSFFEFFNPPLGGEAPKSESDEVDPAHIRLHLDFEVGHKIRETLVPHALLHYTLETNDDSGDFEEYDEDDETND